MRRYLPLALALGVLVLARPGRLAELPATPGAVIIATVGTAAAAGAIPTLGLVAVRMLVLLLWLPVLWMAAAWRERAHD